LPQDPGIILDALQPEKVTRSICGRCFPRQYLRQFVPGLEFSTATHYRLARRHAAVSWPSTVRLSFSAFWNAMGCARVLLSAPARKYRQTRERFEKRGPNPAPAILIGSGVLPLSRRQLFANAAIAASRVVS